MRQGLLAIVFVLLCAGGARAQERYAPLLRDLDRTKFLEPLIARSIATSWGSMRALVPREKRKELVDPMREFAQRLLSRGETAELLSDLVALHRESAVMPSVEALVRALDDPGPIEETFATIARIPVAIEPGLRGLDAGLARVVGALPEDALVELARLTTEIPEESWLAVDEISAKTLARGALERAAKFLATGSKPGLGLEPLRELVPVGLCLLDEKNEKTLAGAAAYFDGFIAAHPRKESLISTIQWLAFRLTLPETREFLVMALDYGRMPQLLRAHGRGLETGVLGEVLLDYADFLSGRDERVRVEPELWKQVRRGALSEGEGSGLSAIEFVKLSALTLYTVHRLDAVPSEPRADGLDQTLADELLDYMDQQLTARGTKSTFSPLFDMVREFLRPESDRLLLLDTVRDLAAHVSAHDPAPLLKAAQAALACDREARFPRVAAALLDKKAANGDARMPAPLLEPFAKAKAAPLVPFIDAGRGAVPQVLSFAPAARALLEWELDKRSFSNAALSLASTEAPILPRLDPLARGLVREAPIFRGRAALVTQARVARALTFARSFFAAQKGGTSDFRQVAGVLAAWGRQQSPLSGRPLSAEAGLVAIESVRSGLVELLLDAAADIQQREGERGMKRLLATLRHAFDEGAGNRK